MRIIFSGPLQAKAPATAQKAGVADNSPGVFAQSGEGVLTSRTANQVRGVFVPQHRIQLSVISVVHIGTNGLISRAIFVKTACASGRIGGG